MSDLAIAAVTATLRSELHNRTSSTKVDVTTDPPDRSNQNSGRRLNLFLYHVDFNAAWRNQVIPTKSKAGEQGHPPLALTLHYLLTAYGDDPDEGDHVLLGSAMRVLHDTPLLKRETIENAVNEIPALAVSGLEQQFEPVRITPDTLSVEELSKLWSSFQTQYRVSASYQASVVLLESKRPTRAPLPVIRRGAEDRGAEVVPSLPLSLEGIEYRDLRSKEPAFPAAQLDDVVTLRGHRLPGANCEVLIRNPHRPTTSSDPDSNLIARLKPQAGSNENQIFVRLDAASANWVSGPLEIMVEHQLDGARKQRSRPLFFALAPRIHDEEALSAEIQNDVVSRKLAVNCEPPLAQHGSISSADISLLLSPLTQGATPDPIAVEATPSAAQVVFNVTQVPPGDYRVRLRINTVETVLMRRDGAHFSFDDRQTVQL